MDHKVVVFLGAEHLDEHDFKQLKCDNIKCLLICGEYSFNQLKEEYRDFFYEIKIATTIPFEDKSFEIFDYQSLAQIINNLLQHYHNLYIYCADEKNVLFAAKLREDFHLDGPIVADILPFRDKILMKSVVAAHDIRIPKYDKFDLDKLKNYNNYFEDLCKVFSPPFVVKPVDLVNSYGVSIIRNKNDFLYMQQHIDSRVNYEIEEYINGTLCHYDAVIDKEQNIVFEEACKYFSPCLETLSGATLASVILHKNDHIRHLICQFGQNIIRKLNIKATTIHLELFVNNSSELIFLEIASRPMGWYASWLYKKAFNISLFNLHFQVNLGILCKDIKVSNFEYYLAGYIPTTKGRVIALTTPKLLSHSEIKYLIKENDVLDQPFMVSNNVGLFFCASNDLIEFNKDLQTLSSYKFYAVEV